MYRYIYAYEVDKMSQGRDNQVDCVLRMFYKHNCLHSKFFRIMEDSIIMKLLKSLCAHTSTSNTWQVLKKTKLFLIL